MKIGRNNLCPCGSGKKYKKCCLKNRQDLEFQIPRRAGQIPDEVAEAFQDHVRRQTQWKQKYGEVRPIIATEHQGYKFVAIGNQLLYSKSWKTFTDFLLEYIRHVLGRDWGNNEMAKPFEERHQILKWYDGTCRFQAEQKKDDDGLYGAIPNGVMYAYVLLAYDLYILRHHQALQDQVIKRLKHPDQFQGARFELLVAAIFIRAGFEIAYEDESDKSKKHPEFIAMHKATGQQFSVEAKSRHRPGVLGQPGERNDVETHARITQPLNGAIKKPTVHPYIIFIDLNLPPSTNPIHQEPWFQEIIKSVDRVGGQTVTDPDPFNLILFTNYPFDYGEGSNPSPARERAVVLSQRPKIIPQHQEALSDVLSAEALYGNIPDNFPEDFKIS